MFQWLKRGCAWAAGFSWFSTILFFPMVKFLNFEIKKFAVINLELLSTLGWSEEKVNLNQILNKNDLWENLWLFSHAKLQLNKWDFPLNFYLQELFLHLAKLFKIWKKTPKNLPSRHTQTIKSYVHLWITTISLSTKFATAMFKTAEQPTGKSGRNGGQQRGVAHRYFQGY